MPEAKLILPYNYDPRPYQLPLLRAIDDGFLRAVWVAHRRSGKDKTLVNLTAKKMYERVGAYYYFFPTYNQGRKILWDGRDKTGFKFMDHIPEALRKRTDNTQMLIETQNGSIFQIIGTDKIDSIVGTNPIGCVFSEYSLQDPAAWDFMRPILAENGGWAVFNYTPRGQNHGYELFEMARKDSEHWFCQLLTVEDTKAIPMEVLDQERKEIILKDGNDALYQQEYMCSFTVPIAGAYYASQLMQAQKEGRITNVPIDASLAIDTYWDLGMDDSMTIWFVQVAGQELHIVDYYENSGEGLSFYAKVLQDKKYLYGRHFAPFDISVRELGTGKSRLETARGLGLRFQIVQKLDIDDGIDAVRNILSRCWFDEVRCSRGLNALKSYHKEWDEKNKVYRPHPEHDWSCLHGDTKILTRYGTYRIMDLPKKGEVVTPWGFYKYHSLRKTGINAPLVEVVFKDNTRVRCTPEHLFLTDNGWKSASSLTKNTRILSSLTPSPNISTEDYLGFGQTRAISVVGVKNFTGLCGKTLLGRFLLGVILITKTIIQKIINFGISNVCQRVNTSLKLGTKYPIGDLRFRPGKKQNCGTRQARVGCGTRGTQKVVGLGLSGKEKTENVFFARKPSCALCAKTDTSKNTVPQPAKWQLIDSVKELQETADVWDLSVPEIHLFCLENGAVVHNSHGADAFRAFAVGFSVKHVVPQTSFGGVKPLFEGMPG